MPDAAIRDHLATAGLIYGSGPGRVALAVLRSPTLGPPLPLIDTDPWGALIIDLHEAGQDELAKRADALRVEYDHGLRDAISLLHTSAIPAEWDDQLVTLTDVTGRLREFIPTNSVGAPEQIVPAVPSAATTGAAGTRPSRLPPERD